MFNKINQIFDFSQKALNLSAKRQEILSSNIANADTPGYQAIDINFKHELKKMLNKNIYNNISLKKTSPNHLDTADKNIFLLKKIQVPVLTNTIKKDNNTVNMDRERIEFINNSLKYESSLTFLKNEIKNILYVIKG
ncbi:flagellar basal body rod protein FlgB [Buchnera aphidicola (Macrosiphoniella sanborni)]|uniref:Flagellar basal body rod protein FlgB n=1 Tax=Buchnera aphidicola (Macrosiphoniella sanborni) TaxID=1241865 RepID=A0A4D6YBK9_9GAMM|nr:flagellar basal body rod protein FlgB [Buchnera aphidicola]QCI23871.1 flagellar basal body rod protein FlgB [Buchnera aphidicola (Macrosiphoniella sanborni)]